MEEDLLVAKEKVKQELKQAYCFSCQKKTDRTRPCACFKVYYCSPECAAKNNSHKDGSLSLCHLLQNLHREKGYRPVFDESRFALNIMYRFGLQYFSRNVRGAVAFTKFPQSKYEALEKKIQQNRVQSAKVVLDPVKKCVYHYFILPINALEPTPGEDDEYFNNEFVLLCKHPKIVQQKVVPMIQMKMDEKEEISSLVYYMTCSSEIDNED